MDPLFARACIELSTLAVSVSVLVGMTFMLPVRRPPVYYALQISIMFALQLAHYAYPLAAQVSFVLLVTIALLFLEGPFGYRVLAVILAFTPAIVSEAVLSGVWMLWEGELVTTADAMLENAPAACILRLIDMASILIGTRIFSLLFRRLGRSPEALSVLGRFLLLPVLQVALVMAALYMQMFVLGYSLFFCVGMSVISLVFYASDLLIVISIDRAARADEARAHTELVQMQLEGYLERCEEVTRRNARTAALRHDARNHVQVISGLLDRGATDEAARYAAEYACELASVTEAQHA